uniref:Ankyrin repeat, SAM and basic leucine zipper domain containing 1 n=1 Tax=Sphaeramia orbicularis TaxID=375764 RepID=A0A673CI75_9TELE
MLKRAITEGDTEAVDQLLDNGTSVDTRLAFDWTPLMCAVSVANYDLAKMLLDRGANANFSRDHWTVLMASCTASASEDKIARCVELLLSRNADPNVTDRSHVTCVMLASREGYSKVINLLASYGAEINIQDDKGYTALANAVQHGQEEAVLKLLQLGADKTISTKTGKNWKRWHNTPFCLRLLLLIVLVQFHLRLVNTCVNSVLCVIVSTNKLDELELLLHGLNLSYLTDIMSVSPVCSSSRDIFIGIMDPEDQQKLLSAVQKMMLDKVDLDTASQQEAADSGSEELLDFLISVRQQCSYLTETIQDSVTRFPSRASQLVFSLDTNHEVQVICNQIVIQMKDLQKEVTLLRNLMCQVSPLQTPLKYWTQMQNQNKVSQIICFSIVLIAEEGKMMPFKKKKKKKKS